MPNLITFVDHGIHDHTVREQPTQEGQGSGHRRRRTLVRCVFVIAVVAVLAVAGCGSSTTPSTTTPSTSTSASVVVSSASSAKAGPSTSASYPAGKEQVCQARDLLQTSIAALTSSSLLTGGTTAIKAAVGQVQTDLNAVAAAGKQDYQPQVTALQSSLQQLETAVGAVGDSGASGSITAVAAAIAATGTAAGDLFTQLKTACGS
jgi:hypothetical protein